MDSKYRYIKTTNILKMEHNNVSFCGYVSKSCTISSNNNEYIKISNEDARNREKIEKEKKRLERIINQKLDAVERKSKELKRNEIKEREKYFREQKRQDKLDNTEILDLTSIDDTAVIPSIPVKKFIKSKNDKIKANESAFFDKLRINTEKKKKEMENLNKLDKSKKQDVNKELKVRKHEDKLDTTEILDLTKIENDKEATSLLIEANDNKNVRKENFINKFIDNLKLNNEKRKKEIFESKEKKRIAKEEKNKRELELKHKIEEEKEAVKNKKINDIKIKEDKLKKQKEEQERFKQEKKQKELELKEVQDAERKNKEFEKERIRNEKRALKEEQLLLKKGINAEKMRGLSDKGAKEEQRLAKEREKEQRRKEKETLLREKEEKRKQELKVRYEEEAKIKKEKENKKMLILNERKEKENKINKEKEQARKERREKAKLIKKAQEESKLKEKKERKTFEEKLNSWYNNLSFVKDRKNRREMQRQTLLIDFEGTDAVRSEEKVMYKYVARNNETGKVEKGYFAAFSKLDVHSFLIAEGYEVYEITPQSRNFAKSLLFLSTRFKSTELDFFLTQLSTFLKSGITLVESVKILSKQSKKSSHKQVYKSLIYELTMGENFSEAMAKQGTIFPRLLINMVKTSELTGDLPETLDDMANYYREMEKTRKQMLSAITYPLVILVFALIILVFIMVGVIPQFVSIYSNMGSNLPAITVAVINLSSFLQNYWIALLIGIIGFIILFIVLFKTIKVFRTVIQSMLMNLPVIGKIIIYNEVTMFTKTFASLLNHNVYITDCMEVLSKITNNEVYKMLIFDTITNLARGDAISNSFKNHWAFPNVAYEMILTGEKTGQLGNMMEKVSEYYQEQHKNAVNQIKAFIEPVMIVILAAIVGVVLLSVVLPMFDMYQNIG